MTPGTTRWLWSGRADARRPWQQWETAQASLVVMQRAANTQTAERVRDWASAFIKDSESSAGSLPFHVLSARNHPAANAKNKAFLSLTDVVTWKLFCVYFFRLLIPFPLGVPGKRSLAFSKLDRLIDRNGFKESVTLTHSCLRSSWSYRLIPVDWKQESASLFHMIRVILQVEN